MREAEERPWSSLLRSLTIVGSAHLAHTAISVLRIKVFALIVGPAGIGIISLLNSLVGTVSTVAGLGIKTSGVRDIAQSQRNRTALPMVWAVLLIAHITQGSIAAVAVWLLREPLTLWLFGDSISALHTGLSGVAILLTLVASAYQALFQGLRRVSDFGRVTVLGALLATSAGLVIVWWAGDDGLIWFVIMQPLGNLLVALRLGHISGKIPPHTTLTPGIAWERWRTMARSGVVFMLGGLAATGTLLVVRGTIVNELGLAAAGHFAAAWTICTLCTGFIISAMGSDYYSRLAEAIAEPERGRNLVNAQAQIGLSIGGPIVIAMTGLAPLAITGLYSPDFSEAACVLQWALVGSIFRTVAPALGLSFLAGQRSAFFLLAQVASNLCLLSVVVFGVSSLGLDVAGYALVVASIVHFSVVSVCAKRSMDLSFDQPNLWLLLVSLGFCVAVLQISQHWPFLAGLLSVILAALFSLVSLRRLAQRLGRGDTLASAIAAGFRAIGWPLQRVEQ